MTGSTAGLYRFVAAQSEGFEHPHSCSCSCCSSLELRGSLPQAYFLHTCFSRGTSLADFYMELRCLSSVAMACRPWLW